MEELLKRIAESIALGVESAAALIIACGAIEALIGASGSIAVGGIKKGQRKNVWVRFADWLLLRLEFVLAADIVRTAIAPSWTTIGEHGGCWRDSYIRGYFLEKDLKEYEPKKQEPEKPRPTGVRATRAAA